MHTAYANFKKGSVEYDTTRHTFAFILDGRGRFIHDAQIARIMTGGHEISMNDFTLIDVKTEDRDNGRRLLVTYGKGPESLEGIRLDFVIGESSFDLQTFAIHSTTVVHDVDFHIKGNIAWGTDPESSTFAVRLNRVGNDLRTAHGPASSPIDNALYDRQSDSALEITGAKTLKLAYDWDKGRYGFALATGGEWHEYRQTFIVHEDCYARKFHVPYRPINKANTFPRPPVGWMTWYALKFSASEKTVLENMKWMSRHLKDYGANCIWVDWEWYHSNFLGTESDGVDTLHPHPVKYPHGLKHVSDEIKKEGLIPALWIGATNDPNRNSMFQEHPEWILVNQKEWCGQWWADPSHPEVVTRYIPAVFRQILEWGYETIKWDCIPTTLQVLDQHHERFHDQSKSSAGAFRDIIAAARETIGPRAYLLLCAGVNSRTLHFAMDLFDGVRIGGDVFTWNEFIENSVARLPWYLCFHNVLLYIDMDNVVLRDEFNDLEQARSRASFVSLAGAPFTMGDDLTALDDDRVNVIKRSIPVLDAHPMDVRAVPIDTSLVVENLSIARRFEDWNVVDVFNTTDSEKHLRLEIGGDLHLETGDDITYLVYDYWNSRFLGAFASFVDLTLPPFGSKVLSVRRRLNRPQIVSTSRHITQGGVDLVDVAWDEAERCLRGASEIVKDDPYRIVLCVPRGCRLTHVEADCSFESEEIEASLQQITLKSDETRRIGWSVVFTL